MSDLVNRPVFGGAEEDSSLSRRAYTKIRDMLITVQIMPGEPVREEELSKGLGVGRTPVREALKRLEAERLVNIYPRRGVFATEVQLTDLALLTEVRTHLEGEAAFLAAQRANRQQRAWLRALIESAADRGQAVQDEIDFDVQVHRTIYHCARNPYLEATLTQYHNLILRIWYLFIDRLPEITDHVAEVVPILQAVLDRDGESARALTIRHVERFERAVLDAL